MPFSTQNALISSLVQSISGLMILSLVAGMEQSPRRVLPLAKLKRKVSALSLRLCAVAMIISSPSDEKNSYLILLNYG